MSSTEHDDHNEKESLATMRYLWIILLLLATSAQAQMIVTPVPERSDSLRSFFDDFSSLDTDRWTEVTGGGGSSCTVASSVLTCDSNSGNRGAALWLNKRLPKDVNWTVAVVSDQSGEAVRWPVWLLDQAEGSEAIMTSQGDAAFRISANGTPAVIFEYWNTSAQRVAWTGAAWVAFTPTDLVNWPNATFRTFLIENDGANEQFRVSILEEAFPGTETTHGLRVQTMTDWVAWTDVRGTGDNLRLVVGMPDDIDFDSNTQITDVKVNIGYSANWALVNGKDLAGADYQGYWVVAYGGRQRDGLIWMPIDATPTVALALGAGGTWYDDQVKDKAIMISPSGATHPFYVCVAANDGATWQIGLAHATTLGGTITWGSNNPLIPTGGGGGEPVTGDGGCFAPACWYDNSTSAWNMCAACLDAGGEIDVHHWTNANSDPESANWTYQGEIISAGASGWDSVFNSNPVVSWDGAAYHVQYAGTEAIAGIDFWGWGLASGATLATLSKDGGNPVQARGSGTLETAGSTPTNTTDLTVGDSGDYDLYSYVLMTDDGTDANFVNARVREQVDATTIRFYAPITIGSAPEVWRAFDASVSIHGFYDTLRLGHQERYIVYMTCFHHDDGTSRGFDEAVCHGYAPDRTTAPTFMWSSMVGGHTAPKPTGIESQENITFPARTMK